MTLAELKSKNKITVATFKAFVRKAEVLFLQEKDRFDGMTDGLSQCQDHAILKPISKEDAISIRGAWLVTGSGNWFTIKETATHYGIEVDNCCGRQILWTSK